MNQITCSLLIGILCFSIGCQTVIDTHGSVSELATKHNIFLGAGDIVWGHLETEDAYQNVVNTTFNMVTVNYFYFYTVHPEKDTYWFDEADLLIDYAQSHSMKVRGHPLVWYADIPTWLNEEPCTRENFSSILKEHIYTVVGRYKGRIYAWDVVNEALDWEQGYALGTNSIWQRCIGDDYIDLSFQWAHEADAEAKLFYNETGAEDLNDKSNAVYRITQEWLERNVPIDGVGLQMHTDLTGLSMVSPRYDKAVKANMERLADLGFEIHITEMDVLTSFFPASHAVQLEYQADVYGSMFQACLQVQSCKAFVTWGVTDKYSWVYDFLKNQGYPVGYPEEAPLLFDEFYNSKPAFHRIESLLSP